MCMYVYTLYNTCYVNMDWETLSKNTYIIFEFIQKYSYIILANTFLLYTDYKMIILHTYIDTKNN